MGTLSALWGSALAGEFGAIELLALGLGAGMAVMLLMRRPSRESVLYFVGMGCVLLAVLLLLRQGFYDFYGAHLEVPVHFAVGAVFNAVGYHVVVTPHSLATDTFAIRLISGCSGISFIAVFAAVIAVYPAPWRARAIGLGVGLVAVTVINLARFAALLWLGSHYPAFIQTAKDGHAFVFVVFLLALFWGWLVYVGRTEKQSAPPLLPPDEPSATDMTYAPGT